MNEPNKKNQLAKQQSRKSPPPARKQRPAPKKKLIANPASTATSVHSGQPVSSEWDAASNDHIPHSPNEERATTLPVSQIEAVTTSILQTTDDEVNSLPSDQSEGDSGSEESSDAEGGEAETQEELKAIAPVALKSLSKKHIMSKRSLSPSPKKTKAEPKRRKVAGAKEQQERLVVNVAHTMYEVVRFVCRRHFQMKILRKEERFGKSEWDLCWCDTGMTQERLQRMKPYQRINHFPAMYGISRKDQLARNLNRMRKQFPHEYAFYPQTWLLPEQYPSFRAQFNQRRAKTFIIKPEASSQGYGIFLTRNPEDVSRVERLVAQRYLHKPMLIDELKFDLRLYVLVAGCDPLRLYLYKEGLTRLSTEPYQPPFSSNLTNRFVHLTNYAVNKMHEDFQFNTSADCDDVGHKRSLSFFWRYLRENTKADVSALRALIGDMIIKTLIAVQPQLAHSYHNAQPADVTNGMAFEVLGQVYYYGLQNRYFDRLGFQALAAGSEPYSELCDRYTPRPEDQKGSDLRHFAIAECFSKLTPEVGNQLIEFSFQAGSDALRAKKMQPLPVEQRSKIKRLLEHRRNDHELKNLGNYEPLFLSGFQIRRDQRGGYVAIGARDTSKYDGLVGACRKLWERHRGSSCRAAAPGPLKKPIKSSVVAPPSPFLPPPASMSKKPSQQSSRAKPHSSMALPRNLQLSSQMQDARQKIETLHQMRNNVKALQSVEFMPRKVEFDHFSLRPMREPLQPPSIPPPPPADISSPGVTYQKVKMGGGKSNRFLRDGGGLNEINEFYPLKLRSPQPPPSQRWESAAPKQTLQDARSKESSALRERSLEELADTAVSLPPIVWQKTQLKNFPLYGLHQREAYSLSPEKQQPTQKPKDTRSSRSVMTPQVAAELANWTEIQRIAPSDLGRRAQSRKELGELPSLVEQKNKMLMASQAKLSSRSLHNVPKAPELEQSESPSIQLLSLQNSHKQKFSPLRRKLSQRSGVGIQIKPHQRQFESNPVPVKPEDMPDLGSSLQSSSVQKALLFEPEMPKATFKTSKFPSNREQNKPQTYKFSPIRMMPRKMTEEIRQSKRRLQPQSAASGASGEAIAALVPKVLDFSS